MRIWVLALLIAVLTVGLGIGAAVSQLGLLSPDKNAPPEVELSVKEKDLQRPAYPPAGGPQPVVVVDDPGYRLGQVEYHFGQMTSGATGRHGFVFKNEGAFPLELRKGGSTCKCTISTVDEKPIPPGSSAEVALEWTAEKPSGLFRQTARVFTNDRRTPLVTLTVYGMITSPVAIEPAAVVFSRLGVDEPASREFRMYARHDEQLQIMRLDFEKAEIAEFFEADFERLPVEKLPDDAKAGWRITARVKPGLPLGDFQQKILIETSSETLPALSIPVGGTITSDISVVGKDWNPDKYILHIGALPQGEGAKRTLKIMVRGPHQEGVVFENPQCDPPLLRVELGEASVIGEGRVTEIPVTIEIPADAPPVNRLGSRQAPHGVITLDVNHAQIKQIRLYVQFAVQGG